VLTCDPNIYANAIPVPYLTFDEAAELAYFGAQVFLLSLLRFADQIKCCLLCL
jgi:aspartokinase